MATNASTDRSDSAPLQRLMPSHRVTSSAVSTAEGCQSTRNDDAPAQEKRDLAPQQQLTAHTALLVNHAQIAESREKVVQTSSSPQPSVRLFTLGVFRLLLAQRHDTWVDLLATGAWGHGRSLDVFLLLLMKRRPQSRVEVATTLWPDADSSRRARLMRNALWNLRRTLDQQAALIGDGAPGVSLALVETPYMLQIQALPVGIGAAHLSSGRTSTGTVRSEASDAATADFVPSIWCDATAFEEAANSVRPTHSLAERIGLRQAALDLYGGSFLRHRQGAVSELNWSAAYRAQAQARRDLVACALAADLQLIGEHEQALELLLNVLNDGRLRVDVAHRTILLLHDMGRLHDALELYERLRSAYRELFQSEPPEMKRLAADLRAGRARQWNLQLRAERQRMNGV